MTRDTSTSMARTSSTLRPRSQDPHRPPTPSSSTWSSEPCRQDHPAHDPNDYEVGKRHNLEFVNILNDDGTLNENCGDFAGMKRFSRVVPSSTSSRRSAATSRPRQPHDRAHLLAFRRRHRAHHEASVVVNCQPLAAKVIERVRAGEMSITPTSPRRVLPMDENIQDWCISRQLWWAIAAPSTLSTSRARRRTAATTSSGSSAGRSSRRRSAPTSSPAARATRSSRRGRARHVVQLRPLALLHHGWPEKTTTSSTSTRPRCSRPAAGTSSSSGRQDCMLAATSPPSCPSRGLLPRHGADAHGRKMSKSSQRHDPHRDVIEASTSRPAHQAQGGQPRRQGDRQAPRVRRRTSPRASRSAVPMRCASRCGPTPAQAATSTSTSCVSRATASSATSCGTPPSLRCSSSSPLRRSSPRGRAAKRRRVACRKVDPAQAQHGEQDDQRVPQGAQLHGRHLGRVQLLAVRAVRCVH